MTDNGIVNIHGKDYVTVAKRVEMAHEALQQLTIKTEIIPHPEMVIVKATVITPKGEFHGVSAANPAKAIERMSPFEVAETSAVGRALGFAGYGIVEGIATADEIVKAEKGGQVVDPIMEVTADEPTTQYLPQACPTHKTPLIEGKWGLYCPTKLPNGKWCPTRG